MLTVHQVQDEAEFVRSVEGIGHADDEGAVLEGEDARQGEESKSCPEKHPTTGHHRRVCAATPPPCPRAEHRPPRGDSDGHRETGPVSRSNAQRDTASLKGAEELKGPLPPDSITALLATTSKDSDSTGKYRCLASLFVGLQLPLVVHTPVSISIPKAGTPRRGAQHCLRDRPETPRTEVKLNSLWKVQNCTRVRGRITQL